jgi:hypothetical protein
VIHPTTPLCPSRIEEIPSAKEIAYAPLAIRGMGAWGAARTEVWASVLLDFDSNKLDATVCMTARAQEGDRPTVSGCGVEYVFTTDADRTIEWVFGELESQIAYVHGRQANEVKGGARGHPVRTWTLSGLGVTAQAGAEPRMTARLSQIRVVSTAIARCVSPIAFAEASRTMALDSRTRVRLDQAARKANSEILKLRPRFAPPIR